jgi:hypothetical protein
VMSERHFTNLSALSLLIQWLMDIQREFDDWARLGLISGFWAENPRESGLHCGYSWTM